MAIPIESVNALSISSVSATKISSAAAWASGSFKDHVVTGKNTGAVNVHIGNANVDTTYAAVEPAETFSFTVSGGEELYGLAASGTGTLRVWRS